MTDTPKPVKAWAAVGVANVIFEASLFKLSVERAVAEKNVSLQNMGSSNRYRVIPVIITPIGEDHD